MREERRLRAFENRGLRRMFGPKRDKVTGEWKQLHNEGLSDLYCSPNFVWVTKSRRIRWARRGEERRIQGLLGNLKERDRLDDPGVDGRIILRWIFRM